jgi:hypothetical protein
MPRPNGGARLKPNERGIYEIHWTEAGRSKRSSTRTSDLQSAEKVLGNFLLLDEREKLKVEANGALLVCTVLGDETRSGRRLLARARCQERHRQGQRALRLQEADAALRPLGRCRHHAVRRHRLCRRAARRAHRPAFGQPHHFARAVRAQRRDQSRGEGEATGEVRSAVHQAPRRLAAARALADASTRPMRCSPRRSNASTRARPRTRCRGSIASSRWH